LPPVPARNLDQIDIIDLVERHCCSSDPMFASLLSRCSASELGSELEQHCKLRFLITAHPTSAWTAQQIAETFLWGGATISTVPPEGGQAGGYFDGTAVHMQNIFDCIHSRQGPNCPFQIGYRSAIVCQLAIASYHKKRAVRWDPKTEDIV